MKVILFCQNAYAFEIMKPIKQVLLQRGHEYLWFITPKLSTLFPFADEPVTQSIAELEAFKSDAIIAPGNEVPHYLRGLKVQIFHGLAGEKKGHFHIRHYFDLYLTQGPYFTRGFNKLKARFKNFDVIETGWSKLDAYAQNKEEILSEKENLLKKHNAKHVLLYAPTFSPSLTSAEVLKPEIEQLAQHGDYIINIKFHDLMDSKYIEAYKNLAAKYETVYFKEGRDIIKQFIMADLLISDTSSVIYEFLLLNKPVITFGNINENIQWNNLTEKGELPNAVSENLTTDPFAEKRAKVIAEYHPYNDGKSSERMVKTIEQYIEKHGVPEKRKLSLFRKYKINKIFDRKS
ncbi:MAG: CDP-glycerol--glycerophosphate glycerophosphotransferase [Flavobacteriaceae bacterium]|nr:CDP-glycerol--glycerophosphate glycerophosphotransferase [Flavobacteriaceae bacterium]|tara:strand:+ start:26955 stop:27995 length:1041 start_codon:yes stop_codon:yes gene_type:complete